MGKRYYVSTCHKLKSDNERYMLPTSVIRIGVADEAHIYNDSEDLSTEDTMFTVNTYFSLEDAWNECKESSLAKIVLDENMDDADRAYISDYINSHPDMLDTKGCRSTSRYDCRYAYTDLAAKKAMCDINGLDVDITKAPKYDLYLKYSHLIDKNCVEEEYKCSRESVFKKQAEMQRDHAIRFAYSYVDDIVNDRNSNLDADMRMDELYEHIADFYGNEYVSIKNIELQGMTEKDGHYEATARYNERDFDVQLTDDSVDSYARQAADQVQDILELEKIKAKESSVQIADREWGIFDEQTMDLDTPDDEYDGLG